MRTCSLRLIAATLRRGAGLAPAGAVHVHGAPNAAVKALLAGLHPTYLTAFDGFTG